MTPIEKKAKKIILKQARAHAEQEKIEQEKRMAIQKELMVQFNRIHKKLVDDCFESGIKITYSCVGGLFMIIFKREINGEKRECKMKFHEVFKGVEYTWKLERNDWTANHTDSYRNWSDDRIYQWLYESLWNDADGTCKNCNGSGMVYDPDSVLVYCPECQQI